MAEQYERAQGVVSLEWKFSLPRELSREQQLAATHDLIASQFGEAHPYTWAMHEPVAADGRPNPHVHCLWSSRTLDGIERGPEQFFRRYKPEAPECGGARKDPALTAWGQARRERQAYTDVMNFHLERAGVETRLHPARLQDRGIAREPEPRVLPSDSNAARYRQEITEGWARVLAHRQARAPHIDIEQQQAAQAWERRKEALGITDVHRLGRKAFTALIGERTRYEALHPQVPRTEEELKAEACRVQAVIARLEAEVADLGAARQGHKVPLHRIVAALAGRDDEQAPKRGLHLHLYEEQDYGR
jgi:hypothetical protein